MFNRIVLYFEIRLFDISNPVLISPRPVLAMLSCSSKKNYRRFPVAAYMALQKEKRVNVLKQTQKIRDEDVKIKEKERELRAKRERLRRLDTKVGFLNNMYIGINFVYFF